MRKIGLLGGMSWESTREYYRIINEQVRASCGGLTSAPILLESYDFAPIAEKQKAGDWEALEAQLAASAKWLEQGGAEAILICTNYMHRCAPAVEAALSKARLLHIADCIGQRALAAGHNKLGLIGAAGTMEHPFYRERLEVMGIEVCIPPEKARAEINRIIFEELCVGRFEAASRERYLAIIHALATQQGAQGIILGCTEIEQLILPQHTNLPLYPSAQMHAESAVEFILEK